MNDDITFALLAVANRFSDKLGSRNLLTEAISEINLWRHRYAKMMIERDNAIDERDEARREVCNLNETGLRMNESDKKREAKRRGWDCFKEKA